MKKNNLLLIKELSKLTDASIYSLRYYERIGILSPAFVDDKTGYRYYAYEQIFHVMIILFCVELDIPLKELKQFAIENDEIDYEAVLDYGKRIAEAKMAKIKTRLKFINDTKKSLSDSHNKDIYSRKLNSKIVHVIPYLNEFSSTNEF